MDTINFTKFSVDEETRRITFSCASDTPYERWDFEHDRPYQEILVISEEAVDLHRLNDGASVLWGHDTDDLLGVVEKAYIVENKLFVDVRFSKNDDKAERIWKDILEGLIKNVSIGYAVEHFTEQRIDNEWVRYVDRWMPYEVSIVSVPADETVGIRQMKKKKDETKQAEEVEQKREGEFDDAEGQSTQDAQQAETEETQQTGEAVENKADENAIDKTEALLAENEELKARIKELEAQAVDGDANGEDTTQADAPEATQENPDAEEIKACGEEFGVPKDELEKAITSGMTARDFKSKYRNYNINIQTKKEHNVMKFRDFLREGNFQEKFQLNSRSYDGWGGQTAEGGESLIGTETKPLVAALEKIMGVKGFRTIAGLTSNISIPVQTTRNVAYQTDHLRDAATESNPVFTPVTLSPVKLTGATRIGKELLVQANDDVEAFIVNSLTKEIAYKLEDYLLGKVTAGANGSVTYSALAAIDWDDILAFEAALGGFALAEPAYVMSPAARAALKGIPKAGTFPVFLCENNEVNGYRVDVSGCVSNDNIFFGDWDKLVCGIWGNGLEVLVNPYKYSLEGDVEIVAALCVDAAVVQGDAFVVGSVASSSSSSL